MFGQIKKVLILAPHPDDAEFGLGGTIAKLIADGKEVHIAVMSTCEKSTPDGFHKGVIIEEMFKSCQFLGIKTEHIHTFDFEVRDKITDMIIDDYKKFQTTTLRLVDIV